MQGLSKTVSKIDGLPFDVVVAAVDLPDGVVYIKVNEGIVVPFNFTLMANQQHSYGTTVNECPKKYGRRQKNVINE